MNIIRINNLKYYRVSDLINQGHQELRKYEDNLEGYFEEYELSLGSDYIYARRSGDEWIESDTKGEHIFDHLFIKAIIINMAEETCECDPYPETLDMYLGITIFGKRDYDECYFDPSDVSDFVKVDDLGRTIKYDDEEYILDVHYRYFNSGDKYDSNRYMLLTYCGLAKVISNHKPNELCAIVEWIKEVIEITKPKETEISSLKKELEMLRRDMELLKARLM